MGTRANRAATGANKRGGRATRRNRSDALYQTGKKLDSPINQRAFRISRHESIARRHNASTPDETEPQAPGVPEGVGYTPRRKPRIGDILPRRPSREHRSSTFALKSEMVGERGELDPGNTAEGQGFSPPLSWSGTPARAEEFVLLCEDLDSETEEPRVHWLVYRIPASVHELPEGIPVGQQVREVVGAPLQGQNSAGTLGYLAPWLTRFDTWHHYSFKLFVLEAPLKDLRPGMTKDELMDLMEPHLLDITELVCRYRRSDYKGGA